MFKLLSNRLVISFPSTSLRAGLGLLIVLCCSCGTKESQTGRAIDMGGKPLADETKPEIVKEKPKEPPIVEAPAEPNLVAKIGDYVITKQELEERLMRELRRKYGHYGSEEEPLDAKMVLTKMIAEKAMVMDARERNYLEHEMVHKLVKQFKQGELVRLLTQRYLQGKIEVTDSEIEEKVKANPRLDKKNAKTILERTKANNLVNEYYSELNKKLHVQKVSDNFPKAAEIHQRLFLHPKEPKRINFIRGEQIRNELSPEEEDIVLAIYDGGKVSLKDWFETLCDMSPPSRPRDLDTPEGVERLLDKALREPVFVAEARLAGLDKDENFLKQAKKEEDKRLLYEIRNETIKNIKGPTDEEQIIAYFNKNKEAFRIQKKLKIDQIWCQDRNTAQKAKAELDSGRDFESVRQKYSLEKKGHHADRYPSNEWTFFEDLWKGEPNEIVGPVKGFYHDGFKWRIVKILEKKPGQLRKYSSNMQNGIRLKIQSKLRKEALKRYQKELLEKFPYEIYADRIKDIAPLNIP